MVGIERLVGEIGPRLQPHRSDQHSANHRHEASKSIELPVGTVSGMRRLEDRFY